MKKMVSIIIPVYNEADNLGRNLPLLEEYMKQRLKRPDYEIIIVDDGSRDGTREIAASLSAKNRRIKVISYIKNMGRGHAVREGMKKASSDYVFMMDADMPSAINLGVMEAMMHSLESNNVVIASRFLPQSKIRRKMHRAFLSVIYRKLVKLAFPGLGVSDTDSGLKAFRRDTAMMIARDTREDRWSWDLEAVVLARRNGAKIKEMPIEWIEKGGSTVNLFTAPAGQLLGIVKARINHGKI